MTTTITIEHEELGDGVVRYRVRVRGETVWSGLGRSPVHPLLRKLTQIDDRTPTRVTPASMSDWVAECGPLR